MEVIQKIKEIFAEHGQQNYGEGVTQLEHAMQCYLLAEEANAGVELRVTAFLHDIGHLVYEELEGRAKDMKHEEIGASLLLSWGFGSKVSEIVASHVWAKRYLVSCEPYYINRLSAASLRSFHLQGGFMSDSEVLESKKHPYFSEALNLRRWDDTAKRIDIETEIPQRVWDDIAMCLALNQGD